MFARACKHICDLGTMGNSALGGLMAIASGDPHHRVLWHLTTWCLCRQARL